MNDYIIYKHTSPSGKIYIGITRQSPKRRWRYGYGYPSNSYFSNAIKKYGWDNFTHEILESDLSKERACELEKELISLYKKQGISYNIADGGQDGNTMKRTEKERLHLSEVTKQYYKTHTHPFKGMHHTKESLEKMQKKGKELWKNYYDKMYSKAIVKVRVGVYNIITKNYIEFNTGKEAAYELNIKETTFRRHLNNGSLLGNLILFPIDTMSFEEALQRTLNRENLHIHGGGQEKEIVQLKNNGDFINKYPSIKQAALETKINSSSIGRTCRKKQKQAGGYCWMFSNEYRRRS